MLDILVVNLHSCWFESTVGDWPWSSEELKQNGVTFHCLTVKKCWMLMTDVSSEVSLSPQWTSSSPGSLSCIRPPPASEAETGLQTGDV